MAPGRRNDDKRRLPRCCIQPHAKSKFSETFEPLLRNFHRFQDFCQEYRSVQTFHIWKKITQLSPNFPCLKKKKASPFFFLQTFHVWKKTNPSFPTLSKLFMPGKKAPQFFQTSMNGKTKAPQFSQTLHAWKKSTPVFPSFKGQVQGWG